jgi:hypothetical protein
MHWQKEAAEQVAAAEKHRADALEAASAPEVIVVADNDEESGDASAASSSSSSSSSNSSNNSNNSSGLRALHEQQQQQDGVLAKVKQEKGDAEQQREEARDQVLCIVCMEAERSVLFVPCRHAAVCAGCAAELDECPICRAPIVTKQAMNLS